MARRKTESSTSSTKAHARTQAHVRRTLSATKDNNAKEKTTRRYFRTLERAWGRQHWWPAESRFEVIVGAYLTQNTAWTNVERAMNNLRAAGILTVQGIRQVPLDELEQLVRTAGYFRQKARRLKTFVEYLDAKYGGSLDCMFARPTAELREELLALNGIGPETADSILLYAGDHDVFVVDAYTRRIVSRHDILPFTADYEEIRGLFERALGGIVCEPECEAKGAGAAHRPSRRSSGARGERAQVFNEMHALIVGVGKNFCFPKNPDCERCPLRGFLPG
jgi:endonuclease III related protein